ncbi:ComF family protein [Kocuria sp. TGY1127_2]|uniref:ComF family protein n=1 Tax=Kocuria sp. TGY1127_2 TaxID=2711328 RepID=UPI0015B96C59|nr:phosphoribosyltransferase family protein [Kocuria sp. TGY1127_2]
MEKSDALQTCDRMALRLTDALADAVELIFPQPCAGCSEGRGPVCRICRALVHRLVSCPRDVADSLPQWPSQVPCFAAGSYRHELARLLLAFKNAQRVDVAPFLGRALARSVAEAMKGRWPAQYRTRGSSWGADTVLLVPVPSSAAAFRRRGFVPSELLIRKAVGSSSRLHEAKRHGGLRVAPLLIRRETHFRGVVSCMTGRANGQKGLSARQRSQRADGSMHVSLSVPARLMGLRPELQGRTCILIDDVATTGSTLRESKRAIEKAGATVVGAAVIASVRAP